MSLSTRNLFACFFSAPALAPTAVLKQLMQFLENRPTRCYLDLCTDLPPDVGLDLCPSVWGEGLGQWSKTIGWMNNTVIVKFQQLRRRLMVE